MSGFDPGVRITRELIEANPDAVLEQLNALIEQSQQSGSLMAGMQARIAEHEDARHDLEQRAASLAEAERRAAELAGEKETLQRQLEDGSAQRSSLISGQEEALAAYRDLLLQHNPQLPPSLISGGTLGEINASVEAARGVVEHVQQSIQASNQNSRIPAGAPMRTLSPDPAGMSSNEKILHGIRQARGEEMMTG